MRVIVSIPGKLERLAHPIGGMGDAHNGIAHFRTAAGEWLNVMFSDGMGWEHVSVSHRRRIPKWTEMCEVKEAWWEPEDCVVQYHPPRSEYVNVHPNCLHLWRPIGIALPRPPRIMVG